MRAPKIMLAKNFWLISKEARPSFGTKIQKWKKK
jgi:hypothetical protein